MASIKIRGKEYPLPDNFTFEEKRKVKTETGLTIGGLSRAYAEGDSDVEFALVMTALDRAGDIVTDPHKIADSDYEILFEDETEDDLPKAQAPDTNAGESDEPPTADAQETN